MNTPDDKSTAELKRQKLITETRLLELQIEEMNKRQCGEYVATAYFSDGTSRHVRGGPGMADQANAERIESLETRICELTDSLANAKANAAALNEYNAQTSAQLDIARDAAKSRLRALRFLAPSAEFQTYDFDQLP